MAAPAPGVVAVQSAAPAAEAPKASSETKNWYSLGLNQDRFFGFTPTAQVGIGISKTLDITGYGIFWTIPAFGQGAGGQNLWTEFGAGVNVRLLDDKLTLNPQIGLLSGNLLSGTGGKGRTGLLGEGIVPNATANYIDDNIEAQVYGGYYKGIRTARNSENNDYLHYWAFAGYKFVPSIAAGVYWEHLLQTGGAGVKDMDGLYAWGGAFVQFRHRDAFLRFAGGVDVAEDTIYDFYKLSTGVTF